MENLTYFLSHHLKENLKHLVADSDHALHHTWKNMDLIHEGQYFSVRGQFSSSVALTRFILLYGSVFKVTKHDLEAVRVQRVQHPKHNEKQKQRWHEIMLFV